MPYPVLYPTISLRTLPPLTYYTLPSTTLPSHPLPYLPTLAPLSYPCIPYPPLPLHPFPCPLPYHIHLDRSRGRNVSFPTSTLTLPYSTLPSPTVPTPPLPYATHILPTFPLLYPRIPSTPLISPALIPYPTVPSPLLPYPLLPSPLFSHLPLFHPPAYPMLPSPPVYHALPKDSEQVKGQDVLVPECIGAEIVWCKTSFGGLK